MKRSGWMMFVGLFMIASNSVSLVADKGKTELLWAGGFHLLGQLAGAAILANELRK